MTQRKKRKYPIQTIGRKFGKIDLDRNGLFWEMGWLHGKPYVETMPGKILRSLAKGPQMTTTCTKTKCANQDGYFDEKFKRPFIKDKYQEPHEQSYKEAKLARAKNISSLPFKPTSGHKIHSTPGDIYGTFVKDVKAFSPKERRQPQEAPKVQRKKCIVTSPGKKGGPGYVDITIGEYYKHKADGYSHREEVRRQEYHEHRRHMINGPLTAGCHPRPYFNPNPYLSREVTRDPRQPKKRDRLSRLTPFVPSSPGKKPGGCHAGCFHKFHAYMNTQYMTEEEVKKYWARRLANVKGKREMTYHPNFVTSTGQRTGPFYSVANLNVDLLLNEHNWKKRKEAFVYTVPYKDEDIAYYFHRGDTFLNTE